METNEALRREVDRVPPVGLDEVLERAERPAARRPPRRVGTLVAALVAVVVAGTVLTLVRSDGDDAVIASDTDDALEVEVIAEGLGPIEATVGPIRDLPAGTGPHVPDQTHTLLLTNTSDDRVYLEDNRLAEAVGDPPALFVGEDGCGPPGACLLIYQPRAIDPGETLTVHVSIYRDQRDLAPFADFTTGTAELLIEWRDDRPFDGDRGGTADAEEIHAGRVELRYFR